MTARNDEPVVLIIDTLPLRNLNLVSILTQLDRSASSGQFRLTVHALDEMEHIEPDANCALVIYNVGRTSIVDREITRRLEVLTTLAPDVPVVIISDSESSGEILSALNVGAQGFLYAGT